MDHNQAFNITLWAVPRFRRPETTSPARNQTMQQENGISSSQGQMKQLQETSGNTSP